jgi:ribosomal protein S18 acetylase RimI-like enzyme
MITVREATEADAQVLAELNDAFNGVQRSAEQIREQMRAAESAETILLAEELGSTLGFLCFQALGSVCYDTTWVEITELYVVPAHRGHGAGRALVEEAMRRAEEADASELLLRTNVKNSVAQNLFARIGLETAPQIVFRSFLRGAA